MTLPYLGPAAQSEAFINVLTSDSPLCCCLQFGRVNQAASRFVLDFDCAQLSAIQAFAIALTSFHARLT